MPLSREDRRLNGYIGAMRQWSQTADKAAHTAPARLASALKLQARFEAEVDPNNEYDPETRARLAEYRIKEHFARMGKASGKARRAKAATRKKGGRDETT